MPHTPSHEMISEMTELLETNRFETPTLWAWRLAHEGMGPAELEFRIRQGSLTYNCGTRQVRSVPQMVTEYSQE
jgi:hypothetical protein